jgi:hypothetical protein
VLKIFEKPDFLGLFKNVQMQGARSLGSEAYFMRTPQRLKAEAQRRRWAFFNSPSIPLI